MPTSGSPSSGLNASEAARHVGVSVKTWRALRARGIAPSGVSPTGSPRHRIWSRHELEAWVAFGCPAQGQWRPQWRAMLEAGSWRSLSIDRVQAGPRPSFGLVTGGLSHVG